MCDAIMLIQTRLFLVYLLKLSTSIRMRVTPEQTDLRYFGCILSPQLSYYAIVLLTGACKQASLISVCTKHVPMHRNFNQCLCVILP